MRVFTSVACAILSTALLASAASVRAEDAEPGAPPEEQPAPRKPRPPHPEPRVIVNALSVRGPHSRAEVERSARLGWGRIVRCYKSDGQGEKAIVNLVLTVSGGGRVIGARRTGRSAKHRELGVCLEGAMKGLDMPKAEARSSVSLEIRLAPGDPP